jgi:hypothetical protein
MPEGTRIGDLVSLLPGDVRELRMPAAGRLWVKRWLARHAWVHGVRAGSVRWLAYANLSRGDGRMVGYSVSRALFKAGQPGWRLVQLLRGPRWPESLRAESDTTRRRKAWA